MVQIKLNNKWTTIDVNQSINFDRRIDEIFDSGSFSFTSKEISYNIPPLTLCIINNEYWLCSSESNEVIPSNPKQFNHNVSLYELSYLTTCYILGTKAFSNVNIYVDDNDKIKAIINIINDKYSKIFDGYPYKFTVESLNNASSREYSFGPGTTMFQALLEIGNAANAIPRITSFNEESNTFNIGWDYLDSSSQFILNENNIIEYKSFQNTDQYVSKLETEIESIEDNTSVSVKNLTVRSQDFIINSDNQVLITPSRIKEIKSFKTSGTAYGKKIISGFYEYIDINKASQLIGKTQNMISFVDIFTNRDYYNAVQYFAGSAYTLVKLETISQFVVDGQAYADVKDVDITDRILEKNQYDLLEATEQPKYCYYTYNSNLIEGMYKFYNNDFWGTVFMQTVYPFLHYAFENKIGTTNEQFDDRFGTTVVAVTMIEGFVDYNPINYLFSIEYIPITSAFITSNYEKKPDNEEDLKPVVRSFDLNAQIIDYDQVCNAINKNSKMMGMPEKTIGYIGNNFPKPSQFIILLGIKYYVSSVQTQIILDNYISYINLVSDYSKIAEVYGVKTQFESTRLPLTGIIDRIVYCGKFNTSKTPTGALITVNSTGIKLYKRGVLLSNSNSKTFVIEAKDNFCFDTSMSTNSNLKGGNYENKQHTYANENNEEEFYIVQLVNEKELTLEQSKALPIIDNNYTENYFKESKKVVVYKDSRERLIFSFDISVNTTNPDEGYTVKIIYTKNGDNGVRAVAYNNEEELGYHDFISNSNYTFTGVTYIYFVFAGPGGSFIIGSESGNNDIYSGGNRTSVVINKNTTLYIEQTR